MRQQQQQQRHNVVVLLVFFVILINCMIPTITCIKITYTTPTTNNNNNNNNNNRVSSLFGLRILNQQQQQQQQQLSLLLLNSIPRGGSNIDDDEYDNDDEEDTDDVSTSSSSTSSSTSSSSYRIILESIKSNIIRTIVQQDIEPIRQSIIEQNIYIESFGTKADDIINHTIELFDQQVVNTMKKNKNKSNSHSKNVDTNVYDIVLNELIQSIDIQLQIIYMKLLSIIRERVIEEYRTQTSSTSSASSSYEAMVKADQEFVRLADDATRAEISVGTGSSTTTNNEWDYTMERNYLQSILSLAADATYKSHEVQLASSQQSQTAMTFLQSQQQMIQQLQSQLYGQTSPWNIGCAYRIPDTNFNIQGSYQQGRANVQFSCVPDEYAPFLGPNGFTNGVGPGNLGLSLNLSL